MTEKKKKKIRRRRRKKGTGPRMYFTKDTQAAILEYFATDEGNIAEREKIYRERIMPAYLKLVENLINIYKFTGIDPYDELKSDCVSFLFETMKKFDHTRGTNAFSYFNVVAKNWLIIKSKQRASKLKSTVSVDDTGSLANLEREKIAEYHMIQGQDAAIMKKEAYNNILNIIHEIKKRLKNENELLCINSVITIFQHIDELDLLNKSAILLYIKELSGLSQKQLTTSLHSIKKHYRELKKDDKFELF